MKLLKNMLWMAGGASIGYMASAYSKDIKKLMKKGKREMNKQIKNMESN